MCGNHEFGLDRWPAGAVAATLGDDVQVLCDEAVTIEGLKLYGSSWNNSRQAWGATEEGRAPYWAAIPADTDVVRAVIGGRHCVHVYACTGFLYRSVPKFWTH